MFIFTVVGGEKEEEELDSDDLDEDEEDDEEEEGENEEEESLGHDEMNGAESLNSLRRYMDQMDQELMDTNVGKSFSVRRTSECSPPPSLWPSTFCRFIFNFLFFFFFLQNHNKAASVHAPSADALPGEGGEEEEIQPLDVDLNLISNLLESLSCQEGLAGPASNLLQSLGLHLPPNSDGQQ